MNKNRTAKYMDGFPQLMDVMAQHAGNVPVTRLMSAFATKESTNKATHGMAVRRVYKRMAAVDAVTKRMLPEFMELMNHVKDKVNASLSRESLGRIGTDTLAFFLVNRDLYEYFVKDEETKHNVIYAKDFERCIMQNEDDAPWDVRCQDSDDENIADIPFSTKDVLQTTMSIHDMAKFFDIPGFNAGLEFRNDDMSESNIRNALTNGLWSGVYKTPGFAKLVRRVGSFDPIFDWADLHFKRSIRAIKKDHDEKNMMDFATATSKLSEYKDKGYRSAGSSVFQASDASDSLSFQRKKLRDLAPSVTRKVKSLFQRYVYTKRTQIPLKPDNRTLFLLALYLLRKRPINMTARNAYFAAMSSDAFEDNMIDMPDVMDYFEGYLVQVFEEERTRLQDRDTNNGTFVLSTDTIADNYAMDAVIQSLVRYGPRERKKYEHHHAMAASAFRRIKSKKISIAALKQITRAFVDMMRITYIRQKIKKCLHENACASMRIRKSDVPVVYKKPKDRSA